MEKQGRDEVTDIIKAAFLGQLSIDEAAERLHALGIKSIGIRGSYSAN